jgi:hypothetical protein
VGTPLTLPVPTPADRNDPTVSTAEELAADEIRAIKPLVATPTRRLNELSGPAEQSR